MKKGGGSGRVKHEWGTEKAHKQKSQKSEPLSNLKGAGKLAKIVENNFDNF